MAVRTRGVWYGRLGIPNDLNTLFKCEIPEDVYLQNRTRTKTTSKNICSGDLLSRDPEVTHRRDGDVPVIWWFLYYNSFHTLSYTQGRREWGLGKLSR